MELNADLPSTSGLVQNPTVPPSAPTTKGKEVASLKRTTKMLHTVPSTDKPQDTQTPQPLESAGAILIR